MNNKKGFTLIELIAVVIILSLIALLIFPAIEKTINGAKKDLYDTQIKGIIDGAKSWVADNPRYLPENDGDELVISLGELKIGAYVEVDMTNPKTDKMFDTATKIKIQKSGESYKYILDFSDTIEEEKSQKLSYPNIEILGEKLTYIKIGEIYNDPNLKVNGKNISESNYDLKKENNIDTTQAGNYYIKYELKNKDTNAKLVIYRSVIVR